MKGTQFHRRRHQAGQTIIIAMIILGVLLVIGSVFLALVSNNIRQAATGQRRSLSQELAEDGIRLVHSLMLTSGEGADWRPDPTNIVAAVDSTKDADIYYERPGSGKPFRNATDTQLDRGGPDGLGPYTRFDFQGGRALVRVRYAPSDANIFSNDPTGPARHPGAQRNYLIIESVGRPGRVTFNDPTNQGSGKSVKFRNYASEAEFLNAMLQMKTNDQQNVNSAKSVAFVSIGIIESARFITNKDNSSLAAELGFSDMAGISYGDRPGGEVVNPVQVPLQLGSAITLFNIGTPPTPTATPQVGFGGIYSNAALRFVGNTDVQLARPMGDAVVVADNISGANVNASLRIDVSDVNGAGAWQPTSTTILTGGGNLESTNPAFSTVGGLVRDGNTEPDAQGFPRGVARKEAPLITQADPDTGQTRYVELTRESGVLVNGGNSGRYAHGGGVYVNNGADRQSHTDESGRQVAGTNEGLVYDWLNPNNGQADSGWVGPFYVPRGSYMILQRDGFTITRDARAPADQLYWRGPDGLQPHDVNGNAVDSTVSRFRLGVGADGEIHVVNSFTPDPANPGKAIDINAAAPNFDAGPVFNGVVYFDGNLRIRGVIPTDIQLTVVSNATIYVEGSVTKGVLTGNGTRLTEPSKSMLIMMAKDYIALNTTQFFGTAPQQLEEVNDVPSGVAWDPLRMRVAGGSFNFVNETVLDPSFGPANPSTWQPFALGYREFVDPVNNIGNQLTSDLMLWHSMDDGPAASTFFSLDVNFGLPNSIYNFAMTDNNAATQPSIDAGVPAGGFIPEYGLGVDPWQRFSKFEGIAFPIIDGNAVYNPNGTITEAGNLGTYSLLTDDSNFFLFRPTNVGPNPTNDYLLARAAMAPSDVRIEASMYAQEGSFFVIPGPPFNSNPNDTREDFDARIDNYVTGGLSETDAVKQAQQDRLENFGAYPEMPFYAEPLDVRISVFGAISENMPPPIAVQAEWLKRWGWIPRLLGGRYDFSGATPRPILIPKTHVPPGYNILPTAATPNLYVPNLIVSYDPALATGRVNGFDNTPANPSIRFKAIDMDGNGIIDEWEKFPLPPMPKLPVSPSLAYFGEVNP